MLVAQLGPELCEKFNIELEPGASEVDGNDDELEEEGDYVSPLNVAFYCIILQYTCRMVLIWALMAVTTKTSRAAGLKSKRK